MLPKNPSIYTIFTFQILQELILLVPCTLYLLSRLLPRASFKLRVAHFMNLYLLTSPLLYLWLQHYTLILAMTLLLATLALLSADFPLIAGVTMTLAINLELSLLPLLPVIVVYTVSNIIANSPSAYVVKQVDYIVWKVIFLGINFTLINTAIWWSLITKPNTTQFDFSQAKQLLFNELLPLQ